MEQNQGSPTPEVAAPEATPQGDKSPAQAKQAASAAVAEELYELTVNGKKKQFNKQDLISRAQQAESAETRYNEAAQMRKEAAAQAAELKKIISNAKTNPIQALMDPAMGLTKDQIRDAFEQWYNREYIEPESLSPDQLKLRSTEERLKKYEEMEQAQRKAQQDQERDQMTAKQREYYQKQIIEAIDQGKLARTPFIASRVAFYIRQARNDGWDAPTDVIVNHVKQEQKQLLNGYTSEASAEQIIDFFGEELVDKIRKYDLERLRERRTAKSATPRQDSSLEPKKGERMSMRDVQDRLNKMRQGRL